MMRAILSSLVLAGLLSGCPGSGAADLLDTAEFEELQSNVVHARELYQKIVRDYPGSPEAAKAKARLAALSK